LNWSISYRSSPTGRGSGVNDNRGLHVCDFVHSASAVHFGMIRQFTDLS